jgi:hypothetical protein
MGYNVIPFNIDIFFPASPVKNKIAFYFGIGSSIDKLNNELKEKVYAEQPNLIWVDKGIYIQKRTLNEIKKKNPQTKLLHLNPDDPFGLNRKGWRIFKQAIPFYFEGALEQRLWVRRVEAHRDSQFVLAGRTVADREKPDHEWVRDGKLTCLDVREYSKNGVFAGAGIDVNAIACEPGKKLRFGVHH